MLLQGCLETLDKAVLVEGLGQVANRPGPKRLRTNPLVGEGRHENERHVVQRSAAGVAVVARYARPAIVVIGTGIIVQSSPGFECTRRPIDRDEVMQIPQSRVESLLSAALAIAVVIGAFTLAARDSSPKPDRRALWI
jgi:hypothetical protein